VIIHEKDANGFLIEQGSDAWHALRIGIPTASEFDKIVTPKGKLAASARGLMARLLAERMLGRSLVDIITNEHIEHGKEFEERAARKYTFETGIELQKVAFVTTDDGRWGCSPDRFQVGHDGEVEIKCPSPQVHYRYYIDGFDDEYKIQVLGQLLICERSFGIRFSHCPPAPNVTNTVIRDEPFIATIRAELTKFSDELDRHTEKLRAEGYQQEMKHKAGPGPLTYADPDDIDAVIRSYGDSNTLFSG
jgi:hypothetical protein